VDGALLASRAGTRALGVSLAGLLATGGLQAAVAALSGSVGLLADTIHNVADALTAVPLGIAFLLARRSPSHSYTYGYARAEDLAGLAVVALIAASAVAAAVAAVGDLAHPRIVHHLLFVGIAGAVGCVGNEAVAHYRIRVGRRIGSAALVADGLHARTDGLASLAVVLGAGLAAAGWRLADPIVGIAITVAIVLVLRNAAREVIRRLMDAVDPGLVEHVRDVAAAVAGVEAVGALRLRWTGHELLAEMDITVRGDHTVERAHAIAEEVRHRLLHEVARLSGATIHVNPSLDGGADPHAVTAHHFPAATAPRDKARRGRARRGA